MQFLYLLEKIRNSFLDFFFLAVTHIGEELFFLALAIIFFWCIDKKQGYYLLLTGLVGTVINQALKLIFKVPRPWIKDKNFTFVGNADVEATGYSFPSGHTQNTAGTFGVIAVKSKRRRIRVFCAVIIVLVAFSRMYLGVHTPLDVGVSLAIAIALTALFYPIFKTDESLDKSAPYICIGSFILSLALVIFAFSLPEAEYEIQNLESGRENSITLFACMLGFPLIYYSDKHLTKFKTEAAWYAQILKALLGLGIILLIKVGLSAPLVSLFGNEYVARGVRYFLIVSFAGLIWPLTFKYFGRMKIEALDKFGEKIKNLFAKEGAAQSTGNK